MKFIVVGAGIGGLTVALCLSRSGHSVTIVEKTPRFFEVGAGLQCGANALHVLKYLELDEQLAGVAVSPSRVEFKDFQNGHTIHEIGLGAEYNERYGAPYWHLHRADLHAALVNAVQKDGAIDLRLNTSVQRFIEVDDEVRVQCSTNEELIADCLIGADGLNSIIRQQLMGREQASVSQAQFTGQVAWRVVVPTETLGEGWMKPIVANFVGPSKHAVVYYLRNQTLANFVGVVENKQWRNTSWTEQGSWQELKRDFVGWNSTVQKIIDAARAQKCYRWALRRHTALNSWSTKRVTLLGDAAHATLPFMAAGAALAMEDARIFQRSLDAESNLDVALNRYQQHRIPRTANIQSSSMSLGKLYHINNRLLRAAAFKGIGLFGQRRQSLLPEYNANTVELS